MSQVAATDRLQVFVSHAHADWDHSSILIQKLKLTLGTAQHVPCDLWWDEQLHPGKEFSPAILTALEKSHAAILFVSPAFLSSEYIMKTEVPKLLETSKVLLPLLIKPVDFSRTDLGPLAGVQIFGGDQPKYCRAFSEMGRDRFAHDAFCKIHDRLMMELRRA